MVLLTLRTALRNNLTVAAEGVVAEDAALAAVLAASAVGSSAGLARKKLIARNLGDLLISHGRDGSGDADDRGDGEEGGGELHGEGWLLLL
jgi:hypothetical protein